MKTSYKAYVISVLWLVLVLRFIDLQIVSMFLEPIKKEFTLSDTQLGLLTGFAFAMFYGTLSIPVAWMADRFNRSTITAAAVGIWSAATAMCGMATSFGTLLLARLGVGAGEAGGQAPTYSLVSEIVPQKVRVTVFALLAAAVPFGLFCGLFIGAWGAGAGWRTVFLWLGAAGLALAALVKFTVKDNNRVVKVSDQQPYMQSLKELFAMKSYRHLVLASTAFTTGATAMGMWMISFFVRTFELPVTAIAPKVAIIYGLGGVFSSIFGGWVCDKVVARTGDPSWYAKISAGATIMLPFFAAGVFLAPAFSTALVFLCGITLCTYAWMGPTYGTIQSLAKSNQRATAAAVNYLIISLVAYSMGPLAVGMISDAISSATGTQSLRYSLLTVATLTYTWATFHFWKARKYLKGDLAINNPAV